ncbi:MAG: hypothetical protein J7J38_01800 [Candidatus Aenigmarchaeota archaeon]|nr:hypothetical protein [Candidatus Aenigmarchaeota archaeon]
MASAQKKSEVEEKIHSLFANITSSIGYSDIHGRIISTLLVENKPLSLEEISKKTRYSLASISLSLDLLEFFGVIKRVKKSRDRKLYIKLDGDMVNALKNVIFLKIQKSIASALLEFEKYKKLKDSKIMGTIKILESEIKRLEKYINALSVVEIPKR